MSLRIVPSSSHPTSTSTTKTTGAPSAPGLHDTLRSSLAPSSPTSSTSSSHPLETRLSQWTSTQHQLQMQILRRNFGLAEPLRRGMELKLVRDTDSFRPGVLGAPAGLHEDILTGRDGSISWEDVYAGQDGVKLGGGSEGVQGWHEEMERKVGMGKW